MSKHTNVMAPTQSVMPQFPVTGLRDYILSLATAHGVSYVEISTDRLANTITHLADDEVQMDEIERLLIALERAGVIKSAAVVPLHISYLREKLHVRSI